MCILFTSYHCSSDAFEEHSHSNQTSKCHMLPCLLSTVAPWDHQFACLPQSRVRLDAHVQSPLSETWKEVKGTEKEITRQGKPANQHLGSSLVQLAAISSHFHLWRRTSTTHLQQHTSMLPLHYHATIKVYWSLDFCTISMNIDTIQLEYSSSLPLEVDWLNEHQIRIRTNAHYLSVNQTKFDVHLMLSKSSSKC